MPAASTITAILRRHGQLDARDGASQANLQRFEHAAPNDLWQRDFKGHFAMTRGGRCQALTVLDDHSRYSIGLRACDNERTETVPGELVEMFRHSGLPRRMLMDNGPRGATWPINRGRAEQPVEKGRASRAVCVRKVACFSRLGRSLALPTCLALPTAVFQQAVDGVAGAIGNLDQPRPSVSSADAGEGRAFPSHAGGRGLA